MNPGFVFGSQDHAVGFHSHQLDRFQVRHQYYLFSGEFLFSVMANQTGHNGPLFTYIHSKLDELLGPGNGLSLFNGSNLWKIRPAFWTQCGGTGPVPWS